MPRLVQVDSAILMESAAAHEIDALPPRENSLNAWGLIGSGFIL